MHHLAASVWTDGLIQQLHALWTEGHPVAEIGRRLGITKNAVVGKVHRLRLPARSSPIPGRVTGLPARQRPRRLAKLRTTAPVASQPTPPFLPTSSPALLKIATPGPLRGRVCECCWPLGKPGQRGFGFCNAPSEPGKPYCPEHCQVAYVQTRTMGAGHD